VCDPWRGDPDGSRGAADHRPGYDRSGVGGSRGAGGAAGRAAAADRLETAWSLLDRAISVARRRGAVADFAIAHHFRASVNLRAGRLRDAEADAQTALGTAAGESWASAGLGALAPLLGSLIEQGRVEDAAGELVTLGQSGEIRDAPALDHALVERMRVRAAQGDRTGARAIGRKSAGASTGTSRE